MSYLRSYKRLNQLLLAESYEPMISWGFRMALSGTLPIVWGLATGHINDAVWITLTAEAVSWVEMKGSFAWRVRTLLMGAVLAVLFSVVGTVTGTNVWLSVVCMFVTGFLATLLKSIGDRASGLAICVYLLFIICNAYPIANTIELQHRTVLMIIGAAWPVFVGIFVSLLMPAEEPFRRQIALIWRSIADLVDVIARTGSGKNEAVYLREKDVRVAIDNSYDFYGRMAHQVRETDNKQYQLAQLRKIAGLVAVNIVTIGDEMDAIDIPALDESLRIQAATLLNVLNETVNRISVFVLNLKSEEKLLVATHINRLKKFNDLIRQYPLPADDAQSAAIKRIVQLIDRTIKLLESALQRVEHMGTDAPVYRSYSFIKTLFVLKPKYLLRNIQVLFNFNTQTNRYALRSAIAATVALFIYKWFKIDHGYWLPFSVMIVIQPYFGATLKKAFDRIAGTLLGGISGSILLTLPVGLHLKEIILFLTFVLMVYYIRRQYAIAAFIITLNLVLLFHLESAYSNMILVTRAVCTIGGSLLAIISGFALLPTWDKKWLPSHLASAIRCNYIYFVNTFYSTVIITNWTKQKRLSESKNSNVFDSFNRYMDEPGHQRTELFYSIITTNVRITRNLNDIHLEQDEKKNEPLSAPPPSQQARINEILALFKDLDADLSTLDTHMLPPEAAAAGLSPFPLNPAQIRSLEKLAIELKNMRDDLQKLASPAEAFSAKEGR